VPRAPARSPLADALERIARSSQGRRVAFGGVALAIAGWVIVATHGLTLSVAPESMRPSPDPVAATRARLEDELGFSLMPLLLCVDPALPEAAVVEAEAVLRAEGHLVISVGARSADTLGRRAGVAAFHQRTVGWFEGVQADMEALGFSVAPFMPALRETRQRLAAPAPLAKGVPGSGEIELGGRRFRTVLSYPAPRVLQSAGFARLQARVQDLLGDRGAVYGTPVLLAALRDMLRHDLLQAAGLTMVLAFGLVLSMARSIRAGVLALLPTFCGFSVTMAVMAGFDLPLTIGNFVAIPFLLGIGVDDGVHLVARLRRAGGAGAGATGQAVVRTSVTTMLAFGSLVTAQSPGLASMGWIIALGVWCCLLASLLILPALWPTLTKAPPGSAAAEQSQP
jgi:predicted RND superfamily exporter protein